MSKQIDIFGNETEVTIPPPSGGRRYKRMQELHGITEGKTGKTCKHLITHILSHVPNILNEEIEVLSMYDGMSCGQIALREMGCHVCRYRATEIDKYAIQTTQYNFPDTIQLGDAFQVREKGWKI